MAASTRRSQKNGSIRLTSTRKSTSKGVKTSVTTSYSSGNTRVSRNLGTGKVRKTKLW
jgi:hypothetical protein